MSLSMAPLLSHAALRRSPVFASTRTCIVPALQVVASRSGKVGGTTPFKIHAVRFSWQRSACAASNARPSGQHTSTSLTLSGGGSGVADTVERGRLSTTWNISGSAVTAPYWPGNGVPSGRPIQTAIVYLRVAPTAQASRKP